MRWPEEMDADDRGSIESAARRFAFGMPACAGDWEDLATIGLSAFLSAPEGYGRRNARLRMLDWLRRINGRPGRGRPGRDSESEPRKRLDLRRWSDRWAAHVGEAAIPHAACGLPDAAQALEESDWLEHRRWLVLEGMRHWGVKGRGARALTMMLLHGLTQAEAGRLVGVSEAAIHRLVLRLRVRLSSSEACQADRCA